MHYKKEDSDNRASSKWWFDRYDYNYRDYSYSRESGSRGWMSKLGGYEDYDYKGWYGSVTEDPKRVFQNLLNQLHNSANIIGEASTGSINVKWSNGRNCNDTSENCVYLSPDNLKNSAGDIEEETIDAMTGKVYLASVMRDTVDKNVYAAAQNARHKSQKSSLHRGAVRIWEAIETSIARHKVMEDWGGFSPYICKDSERSSASKEEVEKFIYASADNPNMDAAVLAISWNLLNPNDSISIPDCYDPCIEAASDALGEEIDSKDRFSVAFDLSSKIASILPPVEEKESSTDDSDADSDADGDDDGCDCPECMANRKKKEKKKEKKKDSSPKVLDSSLLGDIVENNTDDSLSNQDAEGDKDSDTDKRVDVQVDGSGYECEYGFVNAKSEDKRDFDRLLKKYSSAIRSIRNSLSFRNNSMKMPSYGHRSGNIDENSLFKIKMNDDRLMLHNDEISEKTIAVCLLVDESGSMGGQRVCDARDVAITLASALMDTSGISVSVYGHTAEEMYAGCTIREYFTPRNPNLSSCMEMCGRVHNHDGFAIQHTANRFYGDYGSCDRKIMFVISDGKPEGSFYGGRSAFRHVKKVSDACRSKLGVEVYGIGIDNAYAEDIGSSMYGMENFVVIDDVLSSLPIMSRFIRNIAIKMKK